MKNSVKFFLGGIVSATLVFVALAFTNVKQDENKEYVVVRIEEASYENKVFIQICDKTGKIDVREEKINTKGNVFENKEAAYAVKFAAVINEYAQKGYKLYSNSSTMMDGIYLYSTLIFEK